MLKVFRPFWSYDVKKTESWLSNMAKKGHHLVGLNRWTRCFSFQQGEATNITYRVGYDKANSIPLSNTLKDDGWTKVLQSGNWFITENRKPVEQIKRSSVREGILRRNKKMMYGFTGLLIFIITFSLQHILTLGIDFLLGIPSTKVESPMWIVTYLFFSAVITMLLLAMYSIRTIGKTNKDLMNEEVENLFTGNEEEDRLSKKEELQLKRSGELVRKRKLAWMYSPDKLEKWLESMEKAGYHLYRISQAGTAFHFRTGAPRNVKYCVDYQHISSENYFAIHREAGWKSVYVSPTSLQKWTIWSYEYIDGEEKPQLYSDKFLHVKQAKKVAVAYSILFLPIVIMYSFLVGVFIAGMDMTNVILFSFSIFIFGSFTVRSWLYYRRIRKQYTITLN
ncbi:DUF2812 domain-containing protein [Bacillus spongiae]|uniref:DUF2812 domain-containing protein n=1 Tax=Bacillus spongiae TaxID=2683610 RepID=A0ABU8HGP2_9BACI